MPWTLHTDTPGALISHGNIAPWHVVFDQNRPTGLIGWEYTGPVDPLDEVAVTAFYCVQLFDDDVAEEIGLPPAATRAEWFKAFLDGYGLPRRQRTDLIDRILHFLIKRLVLTSSGLHPAQHSHRGAVDPRMAVPGRTMDPRTPRTPHLHSRPLTAPAGRRPAGKRPLSTFPFAS
ncbi:phosphotransferase [Actinomadura geliboluensis]|uniref:phosphotransferase n=1 Tax=Actinomadura geliboluensis TaxID=882440 RepID=UPI00262A6DAB|nr:phosphotransferase [Actinomadura geliboluensis]